MKKKYFALIMVLILSLSTTVAVLSASNSDNLDSPLPSCDECCPQFVSGRVLNPDNIVKMVTESGYVSRDELMSIRNNELFDVVEMDTARMSSYFAFTRIIIEERICITDHVFGVDPFLDALFEDQSFIVVGTVIDEFRDVNNLAASSNGCLPGRHTNVVVTNTSPIIWTHGWHGLRGGWCMTRVVTSWRCDAPGCFTTGSEVTTGLAWCMIC